MKNKKIIYISFLFLFIFIFSEKASAISIITLDNSIIETDTHWTKANSPYVLESDVIVNPGATLFIEPGVVVKFEFDTSLNILGKLSAKGSRDEKIFFTSASDDEAGGDTNGDGESNGFTGDWNGFFIAEGGEFDISNALIRYASNAIDVSFSSGALSFVEILESNEGISLWNESTLQASEIIIDETFGSPLIIGQSSSASIGKSQIKNYWDEIGVLDNSTLNIENSNISDALDRGIAVFERSNLTLRSSTMSGVEGNVITVFATSSLIFDHSTIKDSGFGGSAFYISYGSTANILSGNIENMGSGQIIQVARASKLKMEKTNVNASYVNREALDIYGEGTEVEIVDSVFKGGSDGGRGDAIAAYNKANISVKNTKISGFGGAGIVVFNMPTFNIEDSEIFNNVFGIEGYGANISISNSSIYNNENAIYNNLNVTAIIASNNWWGSETGPFHQTLNREGLGNEVYDNVIFSPWLLEKPIAVKKCCSSVVFIPGLEASRLYKDGIFENQLWEPNRNDDVEKLYLDANGDSIDPNIYTRDIIKRTNVGSDHFRKNIYLSFSNSLDQLVISGIINSWEAFPYDWRLDLDDLVANGTRLKANVFQFIDEIERLAEESKTGKISIVSHSHGGLLAKEIILELERRGKDNLVDQLVLVASPEIGTPVSVAGLLHGDEQNIPIVLSKSVARGLGENMPGAYNLLPSEKYFSLVTNPEIIKFNPSVDRVNNFRANYGDSIKTYEDMSDFLLATKDHRSKPDPSDIISPNILNQTLLDKSQSTHSLIDNWLPTSNMKVTQIAGWGVPTYKGLEYLSKEECLIGSIGCSYILDRRPIYTIDGDRTVVSPSATFLNTKTYYADLRAYNEDNRMNIVHATILEDRSIIDLIKNIIIEATSTPLYISENKPVDDVAPNLQISVHSPVDIDVYDNDGNHTGKVSNPDGTSDLEIIEENIPNSAYSEFGEGKYINLDPKGTYKIKLQGLDIGTFTLETRNFAGDQEIGSTTIFADIPVNSQTKGELNISTASSSISLDVEGDGIMDVVLGANQEVDPISFLEILKGTINTLTTDDKIKTQFYKRIDDIIKSVEKGEIKNILTKIKNFSKNLNSKTKQHKLNKEEVDVLLKMINQLLDNLN